MFVDFFQLTNQEHSLSKSKGTQYMYGLSTNRCDQHWKLNKFVTAVITASHEFQKWHPQQTKKKQSLDTRTIASKTETILKRKLSTSHRCRLNFFFHRTPVELFRFLHRQDPPPPPPLPFL